MLLVHFCFQDRSRSVSVDYASEDDSSPQKFDSNIVHLSDMQNKCLLLRARIELVRKDPSLSFPEGDSANDICL